jgi:DNA-binding CsgD family transcriptional regulator
MKLKNEKVYLNNTYITDREVEVIACILNGRSVKTIAKLLCISIKTVESHIRNVMLKINCNSKESIINVVEHSEHFIQIKSLYNKYIPGLEESYGDQQVNIHKISNDTEQKLQYPSLRKNKKNPKKILIQLEDLDEIFQRWQKIKSTTVIKCVPDWQYNDFIVSTSSQQNRFIMPQNSYLAMLGSLLHKENILQKNYSKVVISGLGGIGKSQLALAYSHLAQRHKLYQFIYWINAEDNTSIIQSYRKILKALNKPIPSDEDSLLIHVNSALEKQQNSLLIYDNVLSPLSLSNILVSQGHIIITTRYSKEGWQTECLSLNVFSIEEAIHYIFLRTKIKDTQQNRILVENLAKKVEFLPLALAQAASYIEVKNYSLAKYIEDYEQLRPYVLNYKDQKSFYPFTVANTWKLTMNSLPSLARQLMYLFSYINSDYIHTLLFQNPRLGTISDIENCLDQLVMYSMIKRSGEYVSIHQIVQQVGQSDLEDSNSSAGLAQACIKNLSILFTDATKSVFEIGFDNPELRESALHYLPHHLTILKHAKRLTIPFSELNNQPWVANILYNYSKTILSPIYYVYHHLNLTEEEKNKHINRLTELLEQGEKTKLIKKLTTYINHAEDIFNDLTEKQCEQSFKWLWDNLDKNSPIVQYNLGFMFENGVGVAQDYDQAFQLYHMAAKGGHMGAQWYTALFLEQGLGTEKDSVTAYQWMQRAAEQGYPPAIKNLNLNEHGL